MRPRWPLLLVALAAAACGGGEEEGAGQAAAGPPLDACQLFRPEDAKAVLEGNVGLMQSVAEDELGRDLNVCGYSTGGAPADFAGLKLHHHRSAQRAERALGAAGSALGGEEAAGLGEGAVWAPRLGQLHVRRGSLQLTVTIQAPQVDDVYGAARQVARKALSRLPA
ncbi:MAG TPA: hypothetical protein VF121_12070 [Thermoanaerobaculia bacterium]|nr:hypothetical protein [Thermoanaerobaculia bacterium]